MRLHNKLELRDRIERLSMPQELRIHRDFSADLIALFLGMRSAAGEKHWMVREIGDLVAHRFDKDVGKIAATIAKQQKVLTFFFKLNYNLLKPEEIAEGLQFLVRMLEPRAVHLFGMDFPAALSRVMKIGRNVVGNNGRDIQLRHALNATDAHIMKTLFEVNYSTPLFTEEELYDQFTSCAEELGIEVNFHERNAVLQRRLSLFTVSLLHGIEIKVGGSLLPVRGGYITRPGEPRTISAISFFRTELDIPVYGHVLATSATFEDNCHEALHRSSGLIELWYENAVELRSDDRIHILCF